MRSPDKYLTLWQTTEAVGTSPSWIFSPWPCWRIFVARARLADLLRPSLIFNVGGSGVGDGNAGSTSASQKFWFVPIQAKFLKIWKMASNVFKFKKWRPTTHEDLFLEVIQKNVFVGENWKFAGKSWKIFSGKSGENRAKILCTPKNLPAFTTLVGAYCLAQQCLVRYLLHSDGGLDPDGIPLPQIACRLPICWWHDACLSAPKTLFDLKSPKDFGKK